MLMNPQIAKITAAKKRTASHHGIWITTIPILDCFYVATRRDQMKPGNARAAERAAAAAIRPGSI